jgi:hypothetical protein
VQQENQRQQNARQSAHNGTPTAEFKKNFRFINCVDFSAVREH